MPDEALSSNLHHSLIQLFFWGVITLLVILAAKKLKFFSLPKEYRVPVPFSLVVFVFFLYLAIVIYVSPFILGYFYKIIINAADEHKKNIIINTLINFSNAVLVTFSLFFLGYFMKKDLWKLIWFGPMDDKRVVKNILFGAISFLIALPLSVFSKQLIEFIIGLFYTVPLPDQEAINFVRNAKDLPSTIMFAIILVIIYAPVIEELIFRGFLQNSLTNYLGRFFSIIITSLCFSFFHFSINQGIANFSIITSFFILSCLIGFVYERQKSLFAPIALHAAFNLFSVINIMLLDGV